MKVIEVTAIKAFVNLPVKQLMTVTGINRKERVNEDILTGINARKELMEISTCNILPSNYTSSLGRYLMVSLKWGKVTVIVVLPQD